MFDPLLFLLFSLHVTLFVWGSSSTLKRQGLAWSDALPASALLLWMTLVLTGHEASLFHQLGSLPIWSFLSFLNLGLLLYGSRKIIALSRESPLLKPPALAFWRFDSAPTSRRFFLFLLISFGLVALASLALGLSVYPDNADSMIYRLPRAFWYASHGSFTHPFLAEDKRLTYYPLDGVALYIPLVLYNLPGTLHSLPSLCAWSMVVFIAFRFARELGARRRTAFFAAWLVGLTPGILAQATSTNDEILAAVAMLLAFLMAWRFLITGQRFFIFLAIVGVGLSAGTKMHIVYLIPLFLAAFGLALWRLKQAPQDFKRWMRAIGWQAGLGGFVLSALMVFPFFFYNYVSTGRFYFFDDFAPQVFNQSGSPQAIFQNLLIYLSQMVLAPLADLNFWPDANARQVFNSALNTIFNPLIAPLLDPNPKLYHMNYRFVGITLPVSVRFVEFSLWSGFIWLLWPLQARGALQTRFPLRRIFFLLALVPALWLLLWSATTLYMEGTATYFTYFLIIAVPAAVFPFLLPAQGKKPISERRWFLILFVAATNLLICFNLLMYSGFRALPDIYFARKWPYDWDLIDQPIIDEIRAADQIRIAETHEKMPYFAYMHWHPAARYLSPYAIQDDKINWDQTLQLLPISSLNIYGFMPLKLAEKSDPGLTYIGTERAIGREVIFGRGVGLAKRYPQQSNYIVLRALLSPLRTTNQWHLEVRDPPIGLTPQDHLEYLYELISGEQRVGGSSWSTDPRFRIDIPAHFIETHIRLRTQVRDANTHKPLADVSYFVSPNGSWLPDQADY